jgi:7,8-dihydropterin-6-yl-methyl-4-(beta-D-ribofuranosyl)aminobenzene 5'-phosphate synthase
MQKSHTLTRDLFDSKMLCSLAFLWLLLSGLGCGNKETVSAQLQKQETDQNDIQITVVYDNNPFDQRLQTAWGFACLVEGTEKTILFDTGDNCGTLLSNVRKFAIKPIQVDTVVISHAHHDHYGVLADFLGHNSNVTVYLPKSFPAEIKHMVTESGAQVIEVHQPIRICRAVYSTSELGSGIKEQSLAVQMENGLVVISGCAHPGVVNIIKQAKAQLAQNVYMALGGFHLLGKNREQIEQIVHQTKEAGVRAVGPCHCSGDIARHLFRQAYGDNFYPLGVGYKLCLSKKNFSDLDLR